MIDNKDINKIVRGIKNTNIQKLNINININNLKPQILIEKPEENENSSISQELSKNLINEEVCNSPEKSKVKWRRLSNLFKSITQLNRIETKNIASDVEIENEINQHQEKLFVKRNSVFSPSYKVETLFQQQSTAQNQIPKLQEGTTKEMYKLSIKEKCLKLILDGDPKVIEKLKFLFLQEPDK